MLSSHLLGRGSMADLTNLQTKSGGRTAPPYWRKKLKEELPSHGITATLGAIVGVFSALKMPDQLRVNSFIGLTILAFLFGLLAWLLSSRQISEGLMNAAAPKRGTCVEASPSDSCDEVPLSQIRPRNRDKLGNIILEILWLDKGYVVYNTDKGVFVHFSDNITEARNQRRLFTEICPELCELRYLTSQMRTTVSIFGIPVFASRSRDSIFDHNVAQAVMLVMEKKVKEAKEIATSALKLAVMRTANDNTIRYVRAALESVALILVALFCLHLVFLYIFGHRLSETLLIAAGFGAIGALFSIITRLQSFALKPCQESNMNYLVSAMRILMGLVAALFLALLAQTSLANSLLSNNFQTWTGAAVIGFIGGFAERLVQTIAQRSAGAMGDGDGDGTPVQVARSQRPRPRRQPEA
jgi:hypothetical protein